MNNLAQSQYVLYTKSQLQSFCEYCIVYEKSVHETKLIKQIIDKYYAW